MKFEDMFQDRRWSEKKETLLEAADWACAECGLDVDEDGVHICFFPRGVLLWDYPDRAFKVLCSTHRRHRKEFEHQLRDILPEFTTVDLGVFLDILDHLRSTESRERSRAMEELRGVIKRSRESAWSTQ